MDAIKDFLTKETAITDSFSVQTWMFIALAVAVVLLVLIVVSAIKNSKKSEEKSEEPPVEIEKEEYIPEDEAEESSDEENVVAVAAEPVAEETTAEITSSEETAEPVTEEVVAEETSPSENANEEEAVEAVENTVGEESRDVVAETDASESEETDSPEVDVPVKEEKSEVEKSEEVAVKEEKTVSEEKPEPAPVAKKKKTVAPSEKKAEEKSEDKDSEPVAENVAAEVAAEVTEETAETANEQDENKEDTPKNEKSEEEAMKLSKKKETKSEPKTKAKNAKIVKEEEKKVAVGKFEICNSVGGYRYMLLANNGQLLYESRDYKSADGCKEAVGKFVNAVEKGEFKVRADKFGLYKFNLKSPTSSNVIYVGESYTTKKACLSVVESVKRFAPVSPVVDITEADYVADAEIFDIPEDIRKAVESGTGAVGRWEIALSEPENEKSPYVYLLFANNGQLLYESREYKTEDSCRSGIDTFVKTLNEGVFIIDKDKFGRFKFILRSRRAGSQVEYVGQNYQDKTSCINSAISVFKFGLLTKAE